MSLLERRLLIDADRPELRARFMAHALHADDGCVLWVGATKDGYGIFTFAYRVLLAHRVAWLLAHGRMPATRMIAHSCGRRACVNPDHLYETNASAFDALRPRDQHGRYLPGRMRRAQDVH